MPRIETVTRVLYQFDELSEPGKERAREWFRRAEDDDIWAESVIEDAVRLGELLGIEFDTRPVKLMGGGTRQEPKVWWSLSYSQGDGACFEGTYRYRKNSAKLVAAEAPPGEGKGWEGNNEINRIARELADIQRIYRYGLIANVSHHLGAHYYHEHNTDITVYLREVEAPKEAEETVAELLRDFMRWIYRQLEKEDKYRRSDEVVDETIRANEYEFTEDGERA
jgi:hypothetical protein